MIVLWSTAGKRRSLVEGESFQVQQTLPCFCRDVFQISARTEAKGMKQPVPQMGFQMPFFKNMHRSFGCSQLSSLPVKFVS